MPSILRDDLYKPWFVDHDKWGFEVLSGDYLGVVVQLDELTVDKISQESNGIGIDLGYQLIHIPVNDILREAVETHREQEQNRESNT